MPAALKQPEVLARILNLTLKIADRKEVPDPKEFEDMQDEAFELLTRWGNLKANRTYDEMGGS